MSFLTEHLEGCTPVKPCPNCQAVSFLRTRLGDGKFTEFINLLGEQSGLPVVDPIPTETELGGLPEFRAMTVRTRNGLKNDQIVTVGDLIKQEESDILRIPNLGRKALNEVKNMLAMIGHRLGTPAAES